MNKQQQINEDIKTAMKSKDTTTLNVLRSLKTSLVNAALQTGNAGNELSDEIVTTTIRKQIKQREDSIAAYLKAERMDLAVAEGNEVHVLKQYLPKELTESEVDAIVAQAIIDSGATTKKDMGKAIKRAVELAAGGIDNKTLSTKIGSKLWT